MLRAFLRSVRISGIRLPFVMGRGSRGFTLLELAIVLAITGLLFGGLWALLASSNQQLEDPAVAQQHLQVVNAVKSYLAATSPTYTVNTPTNLPLATLQTGGYLPSAFSTTNIFGQGFEVRVVRRTNNQYEFMVVGTNSGTAISDLRGGRIASILGAEGGFIYSGNVGGVTNTKRARGAFGAWTIDLDDAQWAFSPDARPGRIAAYAVTGIDVTASPWLARTTALGATYNTMDATLTMAANRDIVMQDSGKLTLNGANVSDANEITIGFPGPTGDPSPNITVQGGFIDIDGTGLSSGVSALRVSGSTSPLVFIDGTGYADVFEAGSFIYTSDSRLKTNVRPVSGALSRLMKVHGVTFDWKKNGEHSMGVLAQDVRAVFPEAVSEMSDGHLGVNYGPLIAPTIEAMRELKADNDALRRELEALKAQVSRLSAQP